MKTFKTQDAYSLWLSNCILKTDPKEIIKGMHKDIAIWYGMFHVIKQWRKVLIFKDVHSISLGEEAGN